MKQETLEEVAKSKYGRSIYDYEQIDAFVEGGLWQAERMYSEEDMNNYAEYCTSHVLKSQVGHPYLSVTKWFEQFKKKA